MLRPLPLLRLLFLIWVGIAGGTTVHAQLAPPLRLQISPNANLPATQAATLQASATQAPSALFFDGLDDVVSLPGTTDAAGNAVPALSAVSNEFTIEAWVKPTATHEIDPQIYYGTTGTSGQRYLIYPTPGGIGGERMPGWVFQSARMA